MHVFLLIAEKVGKQVLVKKNLQIKKYVGMGGVSGKAGFTAYVIAFEPCHNYHTKAITWDVTLPYL